MDLLTCGDDTIHIPGLEFLVEKVWPGGLQLFVIAGHDCDVVDPVRGEVLQERQGWAAGAAKILPVLGEVHSRSKGEWWKCPWNNPHYY